MPLPVAYCVAGVEGIIRQKLRIAGVIRLDYGSKRSDAESAEVVSVRLPSELVDMLDALIKKRIFSSRSEAIREFCREYVIENRKLLNEIRNSSEDKKRGCSDE